MFTCKFLFYSLASRQKKLIAFSFISALITVFLTIKNKNTSLLCPLFTRLNTSFEKFRRFFPCEIYSNAFALLNRWSCIDHGNEWKTHHIGHCGCIRNTVQKENGKIDSTFFARASAQAHRFRSIVIQFYCYYFYTYLYYIHAF